MKRTLRSVARVKDPRFPGIQVRITELKPDGPLFFARQLPNDKGEKRPQYTKVQPETTWVSLGSTTKERERAATALTLTYIERIATEPDEEPVAPAGDALTLAQLADRYEADGFHGRDPGYAKGAVGQVRRVAEFLKNKAVADITPSDLSRYIAHREAGGVLTAGRADLVMLSIAVNWAIGEKILRIANPLAEKRARQVLKTAHEPRRPVASAERFQKLKAVAVKVPAPFAALLDLTWHTGHRISAVLGLRWKDVSFATTEEFPHGSIAWYSWVKKADKKKRAHAVGMNAEARAALLARQKLTGGIGNAFVFPAATDPTNHFHRRNAAKLLARAERIAKLPHEEQGGWHMFRRGWATAKKHFPLKDVAAAGGWRDTETVAKCYQHADSETTRAVSVHVA